MINKTTDFNDNHDSLLEIIRQSFFLDETPDMSEKDAMEILGAISLTQQNENILDARISNILHTYAKKNEFKLLITHDIDWLVSPHPVGIIKWILAKTKGDKFLELKDILKSDLYLSNINALLEFEKRKQVPSIFLIGIENRLSQFRRYGIRYSYSNPEFRKLLSLIRELEIGYHSSHQQKDQFLKNMTLLEAAIGHPVYYHRSHFLKLETHNALDLLQDAGIKYDLGTGYSRKPGFKFGIANRFRIFNSVSNELSSIQSIPLILSDNAFFVHEYEKVMDRFRSSIEQVKRYNGCVNILFHPENFLIKPELWKAYEEIIDICKKENTDFTPFKN